MADEVKMIDLTPCSTAGKRINLADLGISLRTDEETLRKIEKMEREHALARLRGANALFD